MFINTWEYNIWPLYTDFISFGPTEALLKVWNYLVSFILCVGYDDDSVDDDENTDDGEDGDDDDDN